MILMHAIQCICMVAVCSMLISMNAEVQGQSLLNGKVGGKRTLVLLDSLHVRQSHSIFFSDLAARGHEFAFRLAAASEISLYEQGQALYDNLILFAPYAEDLNLGGAESIRAFVEQGGNVLMAVHSDLSDFMRDIAGEFGVDFEKQRSFVVDHLSYEASLDPSHLHTTIVTANSLPNRRILGRAATHPVLYRGIAQKVEDDNILAIKILAGGPSACSTILGKEPMSNQDATGSNVILISGIQGRNNARVVIIGSIDFFSDQFYTAPMGESRQPASNRDFGLELSKWVFRERGILRAFNETHYRSDGRSAEHLLAPKVKPDQPYSLFPDPELNRESLVYRIKDDIVYSLSIEEYNADEGGWLPFKADDVQLEFVMLDAYVRVFLTHDDRGRFSVLFKIPDVYGVFKLRIMYRRPGLTTLALNTPVSIRPYHHDEYERFIFSAYPYYLSAFSMMLGFFVFGMAFLYSKETAKKSA